MKRIKYYTTGNYLIIFILLIIMCFFLSGCPKKTEKVYKIGILSEADFLNILVDGLKAKMTDLGYKEGKNIVYDLQNVFANHVDVQEKIKKFIDDDIDLLYTYPTELSISSKAALLGTNIPMVFVMSSIEGTDLVEDLRNPGGNITGIRYPYISLVTKNFEILHEIAPHIKKVYVPYGRNNPINPLIISILKDSASTMGVIIIENCVENSDEIKTDLNTRKESGNIEFDAIQILSEEITQMPDMIGFLSEFAKEQQIPLAGVIPTSQKTEGLFYYYFDLYEIGELSASLVIKILKGTKAGTISVITPDAHLWINYKRIQELGLHVSEGLLSVADKIIR